MRVIAGKYRSRPLRSLPGLDLRPTADRLRETLFDVLNAGNPEALVGTVWLDLYAGTGAVGIEALSRGAAMVYFVESSPRAARLIAHNLSSLELGSGFRVMRQNAQRALHELESAAVCVDCVFLDPPYQMESAYQKTLEFLSQSPLAKPNAVIVAEHRKKFDPGQTFDALRRYRTLSQGAAVLSFYKKDR